MLSCQVVVKRKSYRKRLNRLVKRARRKGKKIKAKTIHHVAQHHESTVKVDVLKQEVLQLKEQLASLAEPRDVDTINRMNPNERKKMEKSAGKIGVNLKGGKSSNKKDAPSKR